MTRTILRFWLFVVLLGATATAEILRTPSGVNVSSQGASTVFISYGRLRADQVSVEAMWCSRLIPASPDIGMKCDPSVVWGRLPLRYDRSRPSGVRGFTDIMTIPQSLARRAYEAAAKGNAEFYYVRRFTSTIGAPDEYVFVVCRLTGGGAGTPLALLDVEIAFETDQPVLAVRPRTVPPPLAAKVTYTGSGRLRGRWEVVKPGDELPGVEDLLTEATLPVERRPIQRRYSELARFDVFLPPTGSFRLPGPDPTSLPTESEGLYQVLLRVEASQDLDGGADLGVVGEGNAVVPTGGAAGFPIPPLRYFVGSANVRLLPTRATRLVQLQPENGAHLARPEAELTWAEGPGAAFLQVEVLDASGAIVVAALLRPGVASYRLPSFVADRAKPGPLRWRVAALDPDGEQLASSDWWTFELGGAPAPGGGRP